MTEKAEADRIISKLHKVISSDIVSKLVDELQLIMDRSQNACSRVDDSIDETTWYNIRDIVKAADQLRFTIRSSQSASPASHYKQ